jgi:hypothetical protein
MSHSMKRVTARDYQCKKKCMLQVLRLRLKKYLNRHLGSHFQATSLRQPGNDAQFEINSVRR